MRVRLVLLIGVLGLLVLCSCGQKSAPAAAQQRATITTKDGTLVSGTVMASSGSEITLKGDDNLIHTIPMGSVRSVQYEDAPPAQQAPAAQEATAPPSAIPPPAPEARVYELPTGAHIAVRTDETIDSARAAEGQAYSAQVSSDIADASGAVVIPRGSQAKLVIVSASQGGRIRGASDLVLDLRSVTVGGTEYQVDTGMLARKGKSGVGANKRTATYTGGGAALGAIIGAIAGGGKGAAIGAASGAGAGALTQILTKGPAIRVPAESVLTFRLEKPLRMVAAQ
jgi:hypothetical protein